MVGECLCDGCAKTESAYRVIAMMPDIAEALNVLADACQHWEAYGWRRVDRKAIHNAVAKARATQKAMLHARNGVLLKRVT